jgi:hypothetical protein
VRGLLATLTGTRVMGLELSQIRAQLEAVEGDVNNAL